MIPAISNIISSSNLAEVAQSTAMSVSIETTLKSIGRPGFILIDNKIDGDTKKYAAAKEFLYQATCLAIYLALIMPVFKKGAFKLGKKFLSEKIPEFNKFKDAKEFLDYSKLANIPSRINRRHYKQLHFSNSFLEHDDLITELYKNDKPEKFSKIKGVIEIGSTVGSVLGLAILAPQISHYTIHPMLRFVGLEDKKTKAKNADEAKLDKTV